MRSRVCDVWEISLCLCALGCGTPAATDSSSGGEVDQWAPERIASSAQTAAGAPTTNGAAGSSATPPSTAPAVGGSSAATATAKPSDGAQPMDAGLAAVSGDAALPESAVAPDAMPPADAGSMTPPADEVPFSFFVTSLEALRELSGSDNGFGGDLRYGESTGLAGADKICTEIAERSLPGSGAKGWHAFLSAKAGGPGGAAVDARDRIGEGPWYDRTGRLVAGDLDALLGMRPGADAAIVDDLPNERGEPNRGMADVDNHDVVTGSDAEGRYTGGVTCEDWTSIQTPASGMTNMMGGGRGGGHNGPMCGHSWPARSGMSWIAAHPAPGCAPSVSLVQNGAGSGDGIGNGGGYGGFYCFALKP